MEIILRAFEAIGLVLGSLTLAALLNALLWSAFRRIHHPDWAWTIIAMLAAAVFAGAPPGTALLRLTLAFAVMLALPFWMEGRAWRSRRRPDHPSPAPTVSKPSA
jgi:hypothetical protein